jgi:pyruvate dehydrogenase complex dehydrogenase (E1) component
MSLPRAAPSKVRLEESIRAPYVTTVLAGAEGPVVAVAGWAKAVSGQIARWVPGKYTSPGTDGWGLPRHRAGKIPRPARPGARQVPAGPPSQRGA